MGTPEVFPLVWSHCSLHSFNYFILFPSPRPSLLSVLVFLLPLYSCKFLTVSLSPFSPLVLVSSGKSLPLRASVCTSAKWGSWEVGDELCLGSGAQ